MITSAGQANGDVLVSAVLDHWAQLAGEPEDQAILNAEYYKGEDSIWGFVALRGVSRCVFATRVGRAQLQLASQSGSDIPVEVVALADHEDGLQIAMEVRHTPWPREVLGEPHILYGVIEEILAEGMGEQGDLPPPEGLFPADVTMSAVAADHASEGTFLTQSMKLDQGDGYISEYFSKNEIDVGGEGARRLHRAVGALYEKAANGELHGCKPISYKTPSATGFVLDTINGSMLLKRQQKSHSEEEAPSDEQPDFAFTLRIMDPEEFTTLVIDPSVPWVGRKRSHAADKEAVMAASLMTVEADLLAGEIKVLTTDEAQPYETLLADIADVMQWMKDYQDYKRDFAKLDRASSRARDLALAHRAFDLIGRVLKYPDIHEDIILALM
jgi:hypothetical protein